MTPQELEEHFGSKAEIAKMLGAALPSVYGWFERNEVPEGRQYQAELVTGGRLKADKPAVRYTREAQLAEEVKYLAKKHQIAERKLRRMLEKRSA